MQEPRTPEEWVRQLGLTYDDTTDVDDVEGGWLDVREIRQGDGRAEEAGGQNYREHEAGIYSA